jgi:hypothetical protein
VFFQFRWDLTNKLHINHLYIAPGWDRTSDHRFRRPVLYPLSYGCLNSPFTASRAQLQGGLGFTPSLAIYGWIDGLQDEIINDLDVCVDRISQAGPTYRFLNGES